jgi:hypothetical protein
MTLAITDLFEVLGQLKAINPALLAFLKDLTSSGIPPCAACPHPVTLLHHCFRRILQKFGVDEARFLETARRDLAYTRECAEQNLVVGHLIIRYPTERMLRMRSFYALINHPQRPCTHTLVFVLTEMIHDTAVLKCDTCRMLETYQYPIRSEAIDMLTRLIHQRHSYEASAHQLVREMITCEFLEQERSFIERRDSFVLVQSSIRLMEVIMVAGDFFDESYIRRARAQRDYLNQRYIRKLNFATIRDRDMDNLNLGVISRPPRPPSTPAAVRTSARKPDPKATPVRPATPTRPSTAFTPRKK